jgi:hypothetical protein
VPLEIVYAAALGLLMEQLRSKAPMPEVLSSLERLCALARVGGVTISAHSPNTGRSDSVSAACALVQQAMQAHGLEAMDIATTVTDTEFLKLAGVLLATPSIVPGAIVDAAEALAIWNVRLRPIGRTAQPTPLGLRGTRSQVAPDAGATTTSGQPRAVAAPLRAAPTLAAAVPGDEQPLDAAHDATLSEIAAAVARGDGRQVCLGLLRLSTAEQIAQAGTPRALQLAVEGVVDGIVPYEEGLALLERTGLAGARAVFAQLIAATETAERRFLYDVAASLSSIGEVARDYVADPLWYVARNAAGLLGESRAPFAVEELSKLLRHSDQRVRIAAVVGLGQIGGPIAMARLESVLFDASIEVRNRALAIVFAAPESDPLPKRVFMALEEENALEYRLEMVAALGHLQTPRAFARKTVGTLDDHQVRLAAMSALASGHRAQSRALLESLMTDQNPYVRERADLLLAAM